MVKRIMQYNSIKYINENGIATLTLNRPEYGNTLNLELAKELYDAACHAATDNSVEVLILKGKGKLFCGGGDLKFLLSNEKVVKKTLLEMTHYFHGAIARMARMNAPVIIGVNGTAGGGGFSLAITGDIIFAVKEAKFTVAYTNAGLSPDGSSTYFLPRIVGLKRAKELMLTNRVFSAEEALEMNIIDKIFDNCEELDRALNKQALAFLKGPKNAIADVKKLLNVSFNNELESQMDIEGIKISNNAESKDGLEGLKAFKDKRKPNFGQ